MTDNATILVGEAVSGTTVAVSDTQADGFVNPVVYHLPEEKTTVTGDLENIRIAPYTLSLSEIKIPAIFQNEVKFKFDYELQKDLLVQAYTANDRILIEVEDPEGEVWLEKTYALEQANPEAGLEALELGSDTIELVEMFDALSINRSHYRINVYHQLDTGHKKLLASREFAWRNN